MTPKRKYDFCIHGSTVTLGDVLEPLEKTQKPVAPKYREPLPSEKANPLWDGDGTIG